MESDSLIALHIPELAGGGAERVLVNLANEFSSRNINVDLVLSRATGPYLDGVSDKVHVVNLAAPEFPGYSAIGALLPLRQYLECREPDAVLSALTRSNIVAIGATRLSWIDTRIVVSEHNHISTVVERADKLRMKILPILARVTYPWADEIIAVSDGVADDLVDTLGCSRNDVETIYNPIVTSSLLKQAEIECSHPWVNEDNLTTILGAGSLTEQKDFSTLIRAFDQIEPKMDARLVILSEGDKRDELETLIHNLDLVEKVDLPGFVENPYTYMRAADVFVLSSAWEGFGNVLVEAMACGTPVVSTDCPSGPSEILADGEYGPLVPVGDHCALAKAIEDVLSSPPEQKKLRARAMEFSVEVIADQYLAELLPERFLKEETNTSRNMETSDTE